MGWGYFWARVAVMYRRREQEASEQAWASALGRGSGHGMRQRGVMH